VIGKDEIAFYRFRHYKHEAREIVLSTFFPEIAVNQRGEVSYLGIAEILLEHRETVARTADTKLFGSLRHNPPFGFTGG